MTRATTLLVGLLLAGCKATPMLNGESLLCARDRDCPDGLRCLEGGCVANAPPALSPLGVHFTAVGQPFSLTATADDADADPLVTTFTQRLGPPALAAPLTGATLSFTPGDEGVYAFTVAVADGYGTSVAADLTVIAVADPPAGAPLYVSDQGDDDATCGELATPCRTIAQARANRRTPGEPIILAAGEGFAPYTGCLTMSQGESLWGGFAAWSWRYDPALISRTEVRCNVAGAATPAWPEAAAIGHLLADDAVVAQLTLSLDADGLTCTPPALLTGTVLIDGADAEPWLWNVDVVAPSAADPCLCLGVVGNLSSPRLVGVEVRGPPLTFATPAAFVGVYLGLGGGSLRGDAERGEIRLDVPAGGFAVGVLLADSVATVDGVRVTGGIAPLLLGIEVVGGAPRVAGSTIELTSFGSLAMVGIGAFPCELSEGECATPHPPAALVQDNQVLLHGADGLFSVPPCAGLGVATVTDYRHPVAQEVANQLTGNSVAIDGSFALASGVAALGGKIEVTGNEVTSGPMPADNAACILINPSLLPGLDLTQAAIGVLVSQGGGDEISANSVRLGPHTVAARGLLVRNSRGLLVSRNELRVGDGDEPWGEAVAAELMNNYDLAAGPSAFDANRAIVAAGARSSAGLLLRRRVDWSITNNFIHGGDAQYATGVAIISDGTGESRPHVLHNTIVGGGPASSVSRAVAIRSESRTTTTGVAVFGTWLNNLVDGGDATGRRLLSENPGGNALGVQPVNIIQLRPPPPAPDPPRAGVVMSDTSLLGDTFHLWLPRSGTVASVQLPWLALNLRDEQWQPLAGPFTSLWLGRPEENLVGTLPLLAGRPGELGAGTLFFGELLGFTVEPLVGTVADAPTPLDPRALAGGEIDGEPGTDAALIVNDGPSGAANGLWGVVNLAQRYTVPLLTLEAPTHLAVNGKDPTAAPLARFFVLDDAGDDVALWTWPPRVDPPVADRAIAAAEPLALAAGLLEDLGAGREQHGALALLTSAGLQVWLSEALPGGAPLTVSGATCPSSSPTVVDFASLGCGGSACWQLLVGCADGAVRSLRLNSNALVAGFLAEQDGSPTSPVSFVAGGRDRLLVGHVDSPVVEIFFVAASPPATLNAPLSYELLAEVELTHPTTGLFVGAGGLPLPAGLERGACDLALRESAGDPLDLHLVPGRADDCRDAGAAAAALPVGITFPGLDIDGETRSVIAPDVGADERAD